MNKSSSPGWLLNSRVGSIDEKESLTASSTVTDSISSARQYDLPYSSVPAPPPAVVNSEGLKWIKAGEDDRKEAEDQRSIDEYSFPLLSTKALGGMSKRSVASRPSKKVQTTTPNYSNNNDISQNTLTASRNVRFSEQLEQSTIIPHHQDEHAQEHTTNYQNANSSPSSALEHPGLKQAIPTTHKTMRKEFKMVEQQEQQQPKSILRDPKYKRLRRRTLRNRHPAFIRYYLDNANTALAVSQQHQVPSSPDRMEVDGGGGSGGGHLANHAVPSFLDITGTELSPIRRTGEDDDDTELLSPKSARNVSFQQPIDRHHEFSQAHGVSCDSLSRKQGLGP